MRRLYRASLILACGTSVHSETLPIHQREFALESALDAPLPPGVFLGSGIAGRGDGRVLLLDRNRMHIDEALAAGRIPIRETSDGQFVYSAPNGQSFALLAEGVVSPLVIDLDGDEMPDVAEGRWLPDGQFNWERVALFDWSGHGVPDLSEWLGPSDGLLCRPNAAGRCDVQSLFGTHGGFADGYSALAQLDVDQSGWVESKELTGLAIWQDRNGNAETDVGELRDVLSMGLTALAVSHVGQSSYAVVAERLVKTWDWWPTTLRTRPNGGAR